MLLTQTKRKRVAAFLALIMLGEIIAPNMAKALTGGPSQPEVDSFEPVNTTQMVDLFSGDFNYNIPLLDVGGYPVNLAYHAGIGMEQEASWTGLGWNINVGNITRNMRGIPDDFNGDKIEKEFNMKPNETWSVGLNLDLQIFGMSKAKKKTYDDAAANRTKVAKNENLLENSTDAMGFSTISSSDRQKTLEENLVLELTKLADLNVINNLNDQVKNLGKLSKWSIDLGVFHNSYKGYGLSMGVNKSGIMTHGSLGMGFNSQTGSEINGGLTFEKAIKGSESKSWQGGIGLGYNSLDGLKSVSFSSTYNGAKSKNDNSRIYKRGSSVAIGMASYIPSYQFPMLNSSYDMHVTLGNELIGLHGNTTISGSYSQQKLAVNEKSYSAYGYLYDQSQVYQKSFEDNGDDRMLDFNRFNDRSFNKFLTNLPMSTGMYDVFSVQGQGTGGSFRAHRNQIATYFDPTVESGRTFEKLDFGIEAGFGANTHLGIPISSGGTTSKSGIWRNDNGLFDTDGWASLSSGAEEVYFRSAGDGGPLEENPFESYGGDNPARFELSKTGFLRVNRKFAELKKDLLRVSTPSTWWNKTESISKYKNSTRVSRNSTINNLTNEEVIGVGIDPQRMSFKQGFWESGATDHWPTIIARKGVTSKSPKAHHIGEITQTNPDGTRYVYGLPVINTYQKEVTFNISRAMADKKASKHFNALQEDKELAFYNSDSLDDTRNNRRGSDYFYQSTIMPAYAHSYNLTSVLSPDYVDVTGNGISNDDLGTAIKFNYTRTSSTYNWRTPYEENRGRYNAGYLSDLSDDKASYIHGEKELWYLHSIESKTHVAVFKVSAREDGYGVKGKNGGLATVHKENQMMKLDSIVLYSKLDLLTNKGNATPIKTVVFKYSYDLCKNIPNHKDFVEGSSGNKGKLTLTQVYFTYGKNNRGQLSPYKFSYSTSNPNYSLANFDAWGNYKESTEGVPNREFPYLDVHTDTAEHNSSAEAWSLKEVELPSGGKIKVEYEADDYSYVQDKRAMDMFMVEGMVNKPDDFKENGSNSLIYDNRENHLYMIVKNPDPDYLTTSQRIVNKLFTDEKTNHLVQIYYRMKVNMGEAVVQNNSNLKKIAWEYINGWAAIAFRNEGNGIFPDVGPCNGNQHIYIKLEEVKQGDVGIKKAHPIAKAAWQVGLQDLRHVLYPGASPNQTGKSAFLGLLNSFSTSLNLFTGPYQNLRWKNIASFFKPKQSYVRLYNYNGAKKGGGLRVKKLWLTDNWENMSTEQNGASYGQEFVYLNEDGTSTGVASWEPQLGGDQNPHRQPVFRVEKVALGPNRNMFQEKPFMEQLYPGASVGYSKVKVISLGNNGSPRSSTGYTVNEFYTAKDFPVREEFTDLQRITNGPGVIKFLKSALSPIVKDAQAASQGYVLELNDMHGKPKSVKTYGERENGAIDLIAGNEYLYQTKSANTADGLSNRVPVLNSTGTIDTAELSQEYDVSVDTRKSYSNSWHGGTKLGFDQGGMLVIPHAIPRFKKSITMLQTAVLCKVIQRYGIIKAVKAFDYGSEVTTENLLWDKETGSVLLTRTTNEFEDDIYNFTYPAHLAYEGMGMAYKNLDYSSSLNVNSTGMATVGAGHPYIEGDELLVRQGNSLSYSMAWVLKSWGTQIKLIDRSGYPIPPGQYFTRIIRSGRRNMQGTSVGAITTMHNPMITMGGKIELTKKIINTSAVEYSQDWPGSINDGYYFTRVCDTIDPMEEVAMITGYYLQNFPSPNARYVYEPIGSFTPNPIDLNATFDWFATSSLKRYIDSVLAPIVRDDCSIEYLHGLYQEGSSAFEIQVRYKCDEADPWTIKTICRYMAGGGFCEDFGEITSARVQEGVAFVYNYEGDSCSFDLTSNCLLKMINCHNLLTCDYSIGDIFNPYVNGVKGIWRPKTTWAFVGQRDYKFVTDTTDIRHEGLIKEYVPFWTYDGFGNILPTGRNNKKWVNTTTATMFSPEGNGLEEVDALGIYKSQLFGYNKTLVTAVAANARYRQIAFDNFEDYNYTVGICEVPGHFDFRERMSSSFEYVYSGNGQMKLRAFTEPSSNVYIRKDTAHSGVYSLALQPGISHYATRLIDLSSITVSTPTDTGLFRITNVNNTIPLFQPDGNNKYVISAWVTEDISNKNTVNTFSNAYVNVKIYNGGSYVSKNFAPSGLIIDGWQRVSGTFNIESGADSIRVTLINSSESNKAGFDDIRIMPFNSSMKGYVFHPVHLKVMAELDDNNYTTFYEYDAEGSLIRVKRETEKGILTVQENRKGIRKTN